MFLNGEMYMKDYIYKIINGKCFKYITYDEKTKMYVKEDFNIVAPTISTIIVNEFKMI